MRPEKKDSEYDLEEITNYNYFGVDITNTEKEILGKINKGNRWKWGKWSLIHVIRSKNILNNVESRIFKTIVRKDRVDQEIKKKVLRRI